MFVNIFNEVFPEVIRTIPAVYGEDIKEIFNRPRYGIMQEVIPKVMHKYSTHNVADLIEFVNEGAYGPELHESIILNFKISVLDGLQYDPNNIDFFVNLYQTNRNFAIKFIHGMLRKVMSANYQAQEALEDVGRCKWYAWEHTNLESLAEILSKVPTDAFLASQNTMALLHGIMSRVTSI